MASASRGKRGRLRALELLAGLLLAPPLLYAAVRHLTGEDGVRTVSDHQIALLCDYAGGEVTILPEPGLRLHVPWLQEVLVLDRRPVEYVMDGKERAHSNTVPRLLVRGREGTSYGFGRVEILYALDPARAVLALSDSGVGLGFAQGIVDAYTRAVLRDVFGRFESAEMVEPDKKQAALEAARTRLAAAVAPHGIEILELSVSKPIYAPQYEDTLTRRKVADTELEAIERERQLLLSSRESKEAQLEAELSLELDKERAKLEEKLEQARREEVTKRHESDAYHRARLRAGELARDERVARAALRAETSAKEADGLRARAAATAALGPQAVRAALIERLGSVQISIQPVERESRAASGTRTARNP